MSSINRRQFFDLCSAAMATTVGAGLGSLPFECTPLAGDDRPLVHPRKVLLWENTRREVRDWLESGKLKAAILPTGAIEQHNEHMALATDIAVASVISHTIALKMYPEVIVAPPSPCGFSPYWMTRRGTISLRKETFLAYVFDVLSSLKAHGIQTVLLLNGHGGNGTPLKENVPGWRKKLNMTLDSDTYVGALARDGYLYEVCESKQLTSHAGEFETSIVMAAFPDRVRHVTMKEYDDANLDYESGFTPEEKAWLSLDSRSTPERLKGENKKDRRRQEEARLSTVEKGEKLITRCVEYYSEQLAKMIAARQAGKSWPSD